jgi:hypothetical protein
MLREGLVAKVMRPVAPRQSGTIICLRPAISPLMRARTLICPSPA